MANGDATLGGDANADTLVAGIGADVLSGRTMSMRSALSRIIARLDSGLGYPGDVLRVRSLARRIC